MSIFSITLFGIHIAPSWYGLMYALGFFIGYWILKRRKILSDVELESLIFYVFVGVLLGGRLGYVLFYNLPFYLAHPLEILQTWHGGMSFHGGVIGVIIAMIIFVIGHKKNLLEQIDREIGKNMEKSENIGVKIEHRNESYRVSTVSEKRKFELKDGALIRIFLIVADHITSVLPIGLGLGRIGNYLNGELLGFTNYTGPFAVIKNGVSYFPSPLLEATLEGVVLFMILYFLRQRNIFPGKIAASFLIWYGIFRFSVEFVRTPDVGLGYITFGLTMGQILSIPMIIIGTILYFFFKKNAK